MYVRRLKKFQFHSGYAFKRELKETSEINTKIGESVNSDDILAFYKNTRRLRSYEIFKSLKINKIDSIKYLNVINGESIIKGAIIAKKAVFGGIGYFDIKTEVSGIIDLSDIQNGIVHINSLSKRIPLISELKGKVEEIIPNESIAIKTNAFSFSLFKNFSQISTSGEFAFVNSKADIGEDISSKIIFCNMDFTIDLYNLLSKNAVKLIVIPALSSGVYKQLLSYVNENKLDSLPIAVFMGFGSTKLPNSFESIIKKLNSKLCYFDAKGSRIYFAVSSTQLLKSRVYTQAKIKDKVIVLTENGFEDGVVEDIDSSNTIEARLKIKIAGKKDSNLKYFDASRVFSI